MTAYVTALRMFFRLVAWLAIGLALAACNKGDESTASSPAFSGPDENGIILFESASPDGYGNLLRNGAAGFSNVSVRGTLLLPGNVDGEVPAVVIGHGSRGTGQKQLDWAALFNENGIAAFIIDSYAPRQITNGQSLSSSVEAVDALFALAVLSSLPQIDSSRIGLMDFGAGMINTVYTEIQNSVNVQPSEFAAYIILYANCNIRQRSVNHSGAPILLLHGDADDWNSAAACRDYADTLQSTQADITLTTYPGAYHGFDGTGDVSVDSEFLSNSGCAGEFRLDTRVLLRFDTGEVFADNETYQGYLDDCRTLGVHTGGNTDARTAARSDVMDFLSRIFAL